MSTLGAPIKKNPKKTTPKKETPTVDTNQTKQEEPKNEEKNTEVTKTEEKKTEEKKTETTTPTKTTLGGAPTKTTLGGVKTTLGGVKTSLGGAKTTLGGVPTKTTLGGSTAKTTLGGITPTKTPGNQVPPKENKDQPNNEIKPTTTSDTTTTTEGTNEPTNTEETPKEKEKKKKKKKKTEKPEEKEKPEEIEKPEDLKTKPKKVAKGKALVGKLLAEKLNKKKEEEERLRREEEERLKKEEEERIKREEEEKKKKELELEKARINKIEREKRKKEEEIRQKELQRLEKMKKYGLKQPTKSTPPLTNPSQSSDPSSSTDTTTHNPSDKPQEKKKKNKKTKTSKFHERLEEEKRIREEEEKQNNPQLSTPSVDNWEDITVDVPTETVKEEVEVGDNWEEMLENDQIVIPSTNTTNTNITGTNNTTTQTQIEETKKENPSSSTSSSSTSSNEKGEESSNETVSTTSTTSSTTSSDTDKSFSSSNELRSPIICVLGHVDVGKTKILDKIRQTHVQDDEAGGITQQIGATWFPIEALKERVSKVITKKQFTLDVPGLLIIDTPGHESFTNLRSRGSSLCDLAILVVDIMHGIEQQTIESIKLLQMKGTPFIVALNKIDRIYGWNKMEGAAFNTTFKKQPKNTQLEFKNLLNRTILHFAEQSINAKLYKEIKDFNEWVALVPTSAHTGEGIPDLLLLITQYAQKKLKNTIAYEEQFEATVLEVKPVEGIGKTIDVIIVNGVLKKGDKIVLCGMNGAIVTNVKAILTPHPLKELRVKNEYLQHDSIKAAQGVKIVATGTDLEKAVPGSPLFVVENEKQLEEATQNVMKDYEKLKANINKEGQGVYVNSSTLGALEALLHFLKSSKIPVCDFSIGPVHKKDVMKAGTMIERKMKKYAVILAFDVKVTPEAELEAKKLGVTIMTADIIYHLTDQFELYLKKLDEEERKEHEGEAVFPCVLEIIPEYIFNSKNPIVVGVKVLDGELRRGTPICIPGKDMDLGVVSNIQFNNQDREFGKKGEEVAVSISPNTGAQHYSYGRHFTSQDKLFSKISRRSIDAMKMFFMEDVKKWLELFKKLKILFNID